MTSSAKYFIKDSTGSYIDWSYTTVSGFSVADPVATVVGGTGNDAVFAGAGSKVDFTDTGNGDDKLFLTGRFADYTQSVNTASGVYTFTRSSGELIQFQAGSDNDSVYFADGHVNLNGTATQPGGASLYNATNETYRQLAVNDLVAGGTPAYPLNGLPASGGQPIRLTLSGPSGVDVPLLPVAGESMVVKGGSGADRVYVKAGTSVDFTDSGNGDDQLYLTGRFSDYVQSVDANTGLYTFTRGVNEVVKFSSTGDHDTLYFADGHVSFNSSLVQKSGTALYSDTNEQFRQLLQADLDTGGARRCSADHRPGDRRPGSDRRHQRPC